MQLALAACDAAGGRQLVLRYGKDTLGPMRAQLVLGGMGYDCNGGQAQGALAASSRDIPILGGTAYVYAPDVPASGAATLLLTFRDGTTQQLPVTVDAPIYDSSTFVLAGQLGNIDGGPRDIGEVPMPEAGA